MYDIMCMLHMLYVVRGLHERAGEGRGRETQGKPCRSALIGRMF